MKMFCLGKVFAPVFIAVPAFVFLGSCSDCIRGEGSPVVKTLELAPFSALHLSGSTGVEILQGASQHVEIKAPENIIRLINTSITGNTWEVSFEECIRGNVEIKITTPNVHTITITGSGNIKSLNNLNVERLDVIIAGSGNADLMVNSPWVNSTISGSGNINLKGSATTHNIIISGSGNIKSPDFETVITKAEVAGPGNAEVNASELIETRITGSGNLEYKDTGARIVSDITGSGEIVKK